MSRTPPSAGQNCPQTASSLSDKLQLEVLECTPARTVVAMPVAGNTQPMGALHGGASAALCETAASLAACAHGEPNGLVGVGTNLSITHLRPVFSGRVVAEAVATLLGRTVTAHSVQVHDDAGRLVAIAQVSNQLIAKPV